MTHNNAPLPTGQQFSSASVVPAPLTSTYGTHVFSFPSDWAVSELCGFHVDPLPKNVLHLVTGRYHFKLPEPWVCPCCGEKVFWALRGYADAKYPAYQFTPQVTLEFLSIVASWAKFFGLVHP